MCVISFSFFLRACVLLVSNQDYLITNECPCNENKFMGVKFIISIKFHVLIFFFMAFNKN